MAPDALYSYMQNATWVHNFADNSRTINNTTTGFYAWVRATAAVANLPFNVLYYKTRHPSRYSDQWYIKMETGGNATYAVATNRNWSIPSLYGPVTETLITHACGNFTVYMVGFTTRTQTGGMQAAISTDRAATLGLAAAVCLAGDLDCELYAAIEGWRDAQCAQRAAIQGDTSIEAAMRACVQADQTLALGLYGAIGKDFSVTSALRAVCQRDYHRNFWIKAAIQGETGTTSALRAYVIKSRKDIIRLEFEPRLPQDFAQNSVPNWPSEPFDSRRQVVG